MTTKWALFNGKRVHPDLIEPLNKIPRAILQYMKPRVTQGYGFAAASKGTHSTGHAVDYTTRGLSNEQIKTAVLAMQEAGFAVILRLRNELGPGNPEHLHTALMGFSNSEAVHQATRPGGRHHIDAKLRNR